MKALTAPNLFTAPFLGVIVGSLLTMTLSSMGVMPGAGYSLSDINLIELPERVLRLGIGFIFLPLLNLPSFLGTLLALKVPILRRRPEAIVLLIAAIAYIIPWWSLAIGGDLRMVAGTTATFVLLAVVKNKRQDHKIMLSGISLLLICPVLMQINPDYSRHAIAPIIMAAENLPAVPEGAMKPGDRQPSIAEIEQQYDSTHAVTCRSNRNGVIYYEPLKRNGPSYDIVSRSHAIGSRSTILLDDLKRQGFDIDHCIGGYSASDSRSIALIVEVGVNISWKFDNRDRITALGVRMHYASL